MYWYRWSQPYQKYCVWAYSKPWSANGVSFVSRVTNSTESFGRVLDFSRGSAKNLTAHEYPKIIRLGTCGNSCFPFHSSRSIAAYHTIIGINHNNNLCRNEIFYNYDGFMKRICFIHNSYIPEHLSPVPEYNLQFTGQQWRENK